MTSRPRRTRRQAEALTSYEWERRKAEAAEESKLLTQESETPPRTTQEIPSAPGWPF